MLKRLLFFAYGAACYLIFVATFLYAIAFVGGFAVPTRLDDHRQSSLATALMIDCALLALFAIQHSVMARRWFKERWTQIVPWTVERSTYVLCASLALLLLFWQWRPIGIQIWSVENGVARAAMWTLFVAGWATVLTVTFLINHFDLFGLRQVWLPLIGRPYTRVSFRTPAAIPVRPASSLLRLPALVLDDAHDDARASRVRADHDRVHRPGHPVRGTGSRRGTWRGLRGIQAQRGDAAAGDTRTIGDAARTCDHACGNGPGESRVAAPPNTTKFLRGLV